MKVLMKVLVIGAQGQLGQEVVLAFKAAQHEVIACGSKELDITRKTQITEVIAAQQDCQFIINCAAYTAVDKAESEADLAYAINALGVKNLAEVAKQYQLSLMHISTDYVFDGTKTAAYMESDTTHPQNVYGKTKCQGEEFLRAVWEQHIILRTSWVFGRFGHNFVKTMLRLFNERSEITVIDDQYGCPTPAEDIAAAILTMCEYNLHNQAHWGTYHYCGNPQTTWFGFAKRIYELAQPEKPCLIKAINTEAYPTPAQRPKNSVLSIEKIFKDFGIKAPSWEAGLKRVLTELGQA
jgi:dTDP-4-dehydrorhamnose reductase